MTLLSGHAEGAARLKAEATLRRRTMGYLTLRSTILVTAAACMLACHPTGIDDASETDTVITRKAKDYNYAQNRTYDMADTIADLCGLDPENLPDGGGAAGERSTDRNLDCNPINHNFDAQILAKIRQDFEALGYRPVDKDAGETADVALLVGAISSNNWVAYTYYPWWYYPYYPPYYGWGIYYPYYPATSVVNYPTGSLMMELVSLKERDEEAMRTPSIWSGTITGLLAQGDSSTVERIDSTIDQAFAQSSYLKVGAQ